jgi:sterol-4alpha-carboxylate 3-dehydrogenase (decarboxylating)
LDIIMGPRDIDTVFHCASNLDTSFLGPSKESEKINVEGTRLLLEMSKKFGVKRFIYTSTHNVAFYGDTIVDGVEGNDVFPEKHRDHYSRTKAKAELLVKTANNPKDGMRTVIIRPAAIWGQGDKHFRKIYNCSFLPIRPTPMGTDWNWVEIHNLAYIHYLAAVKLEEECKDESDGPVSGNTYFTGNTAPSGHYWNEILKEMGRPPLDFYMPAWLWLLFGFISELLGSFLSPYSNISVILSFTTNVS